MFQVGAISQRHPPKSEEAGFHVIQLQFQTAPQDTAWSQALLKLQIHDQNKDCCFQAIKSEVVYHLGIDNGTSFFQIIFDSYFQKSASSLLPFFLLQYFNFYLFPHFGGFFFFFCSSFSHFIIRTSILFLFFHLFLRTIILNKQFY